MKVSAPHRGWTSHPLCGRDSKPGRTPLIVRGNLSRQPEPALAELLAEHVEQIEVLLPEPPSGADGIIRELGGLVRGIPALNDLLEFTIERFWIVLREPLRAQHAP